MAIKSVCLCVSVRRKCEGFLLIFLEGFYVCCALTAATTMPILAWMATNCWIEDKFLLKRLIFFFLDGLFILFGQVLNEQLGSWIGLWPKHLTPKDCMFHRAPSENTTLCNSRIWKRTQWAPWAPINLCSFTLRAHTTKSQITSIPIWLRNGWK